ncbi:MAG: class I SAM-dependent methyltransferase [Verrucomicrobiales bacterium]
MGTPIDYETASFDVVTCIETIEHLPDDILAETMTEISRLLKPGGMLLLTTPHNEDLDANMHFCPFCNSEFHRMQHVQSWQLEDVSDLMFQHKIEPLFCRDLRLASYGYEPPAAAMLQHFPRGLLHYAKFNLLKALDRAAPRPFPQGRVTASYDLRNHGRNLIAIGIKQ